MITKSKPIPKTYTSKICIGFFIVVTILVSHFGQGVSYGMADLKNLVNSIKSDNKKITIIRGIVKDKSSTPNNIAGAKIKLLDAKNSLVFSTLTNAQGVYEINLDLFEGNYKLTCLADNFKQAEINCYLNRGRIYDTDFDFSLEFKEPAVSDPAMLFPGELAYGSISAKGKSNTYYFTASAGDCVIIRSTKTTDINYYDSYYFNVYIELYGPNGALITKANDKIGVTLPVTGKYTIIVRDGDKGLGPNEDIGNYCLIFQRLNNPTSPAIGEARTLTGAITTKGRFKLYNFNASSNDNILIDIARTTGGDYYFKPFIELYGPDGSYFGCSDSQIKKSLNLNGKYTILARDSSNENTGNYSLSWKKQNSTPTVDAITPSSGASLSGQQVIFTANYSDPERGGWQNNLQEAHFLINVSTSGYKCFWAYYDIKSAKLYLRDNNNSNWLGGFSPCSNNIIQNSYAELDCSKVVVSGSSSTLNISWAVTFKAAFSGKTYKMYLKAIDIWGSESSFVQRGVWQVDSSDRLIISDISPTDNSIFEAGDIVSIIPSLDGQPGIEYQFLIDGILKQPWSVSSEYKWRTSWTDAGKHIVRVDARNASGAAGFKEIHIYLARKPLYAE